MSPGRGAVRTRHARDLVLHPIVLASVLVWIANDHVFKALAPGFVTGKLSDVAGLVAFPVILLATFPSRWTSGARLEGASLTCALATTLAFVVINVDVAAAHVVTPMFGVLPHALRGDAPGIWLGPVAHVSDVEDLIVLPFAFVGTAILAGRRFRFVVLAWIALSLLGSASSAAAQDAAVEVPAEKGRSTGFSAAAEVVVGGSVAAEPVDRGNYRYLLTGMRVSLELTRGRARFGAFGTALHGNLTQVPASYAEFGTVHPTYQGYAVGIYAGFTRRRFRLDASVMVVSASLARGRGDMRWGLATLRIAIGNRERAAFTSQLGSSDGYLTDGRFFDGGILVERSRFSLRACVGVGLVVTPDIAGSSNADEGLRLRPSYDDHDRLFIEPDVFGDVEARVRLTPRLALEAWIQGGTQLPRGRLGLRVAL